MAVSAVWRLVYLLATDSHLNLGACQSTQAGRAVPVRTHIYEINQ